MGCLKNLDKYIKAQCFLFRSEKGGVGVVNCGALFVIFKSSLTLKMLLLTLIFSGLKHFVVKFKRLIDRLID